MNGEGPGVNPGPEPIDTAKRDLVRSLHRDGCLVAPATIGLRSRLSDSISGAPQLGRPRFEWCIRYRRVDWQYPQVRIFQFETAAIRFAKKLQRDDRPDLAPLVFVALERREVGRWEMVSAAGAVEERAR